MVAVDRSLAELKEWFEEEKQTNYLDDIKFFPFVDMATTRDSFAHSVMEVIKAHSAGKSEAIRNI